MKDLERTQLMYAVLDGEATADEARALERLLAAEPAARAQFEELRSLFDALSCVPKAFPPEGLVAVIDPAGGLTRRRPTFPDAGCNCCNFKESWSQAGEHQRRSAQYPRQDLTPG
jgi:hypothetical protein